MAQFTGFNTNATDATPTPQPQAQAQVAAPSPPFGTPRSALIKKGKHGKAGDGARLNIGNPADPAAYIAANFTSPTGKAYLKQPDGSLVAYPVPFPPGFVPPAAPSASNPFALLPPPTGAQTSTPLQAPAEQPVDATPAPPEVQAAYPQTAQVGSPDHQHYRLVMRETHAHPRHSLRVARHAFAHR